MDLRRTKEELDNAIPFHTLLDVSANKSKAQLAHKGTLGQRHKPSAEALRASVMRRSVSSNFSSNASFHTPSESLEESREPTPDSDSGYVIASVTTTTTTTATPTPAPTPTPLNQVLKKHVPPPQPQPESEPATQKVSFLAELQNRGKPKTTTNGASNPIPFKSSPPKDDNEDEDEPVVNPFKVLRPVSTSNPKRIIPPLASAAPTLADQLKARLEKRRRSLEESVEASQENASQSQETASQPQDNAKTSHSVSKVSQQNVTNDSNKSAQVEKKVPDVAKNIPSRTLQQSAVITVTPKDSKPGNKPTGPVEDWTKENVSQWLTDSGIDSFKNLFIDKSINGSALLNFESGSGLKDLGVKNKEDREKIKKKIKELKTQNAKDKKETGKTEKLLKKVVVRKK